MSNMTEKDLRDLRVALVNWFQSQEAEPLAASFVCVQLAGILVAELSDTRGISMPEGLKILEKCLRKSAAQTMKQINAEKKP